MRLKGGSNTTPFWLPCTSVDVILTRKQRGAHRKDPAKPGSYYVLELFADRKALKVHMDVVMKAGGPEKSKGPRLLAAQPVPTIMPVLGRPVRGP